MMADTRHGRPVFQAQLPKAQAIRDRLKGR